LKRTRKVFQRTPEIDTPSLLGWDDEKIYFYDASRKEHCVSDEPKLMAKLITVCKDFFKNKTRS